MTQERRLKLDIVLFTATFGATWLTVPWLYPAEIFPLAVRAKGNAFGVVGWSIGNGWLVSVSPECFCSEDRHIRDLGKPTSRY